MHSRLEATILLSVLAVGCSGNPMPGSDASMSASKIAASEVPDFPAGSSIEDVSNILKASPTEFAPTSKRTSSLRAPDACILVHEFTTQVGDDCVIGMSGRVLGVSPHYFIFTNESLRKVVRRPARVSTLEPPADPWERMDVALSALPETQAAMAANVRDDLERFERGTQYYEPNPASGIFPPSNRKPEVEESHDILQWRPGDTVDRLNQIYGDPMRIVSLDNGKSARLYATKAKCGGFIAAIVINGTLQTVFSHDFFDPRFWLDLLGETHSPPWDPFAILRQPTQQD